MATDDPATRDPSTGPAEANEPTEHQPGDPFDAAYRSVRAWVLLLGLTAVFIAIDLWSKYLAFGNIADQPVRFTREDVMGTERLSTLIPMHRPVEVIPGVLELTLVLNPGAVFGLGAGMRWAFVAFTIFAAGFAVWLFGWWTRRRDWLTHGGFALLIGGGLGNLYDRVIYACVRDFLHPLPGVQLPFGLSWPGGSSDLWPYVSNIADAFLLVGIGILLVYFWRDHAHHEQDAPGERAKAGGAPAETTAEADG